MERFKNILAYVGDGAAGGAAVERAARLAGHNAAALTLLTVVENPPWYTRLVVSSNEPEDILIRQRTEDLERLAEPIRRDGVAVSTSLLRGHSYLETVRKVLRDGHDLLLKDAESEEPLFFGSTDMHLLRGCPCPVWLVKPSQYARPFERVVAAIDPVPGDEPRNALNAKILELATSLAEREGSELHVVHAWTFFGEEVLRTHHRTPCSQEEVDEMVASARVEVQKTVDNTVASFSDRIGKGRVHLLKGFADRVIPKFVEEQKVELIVMGTMARTGVPGFLIGNTAETILHRVRCSVLTVKPDGFVSPVS